MLVENAKVPSGPGAQCARLSGGDEPATTLRRAGASAQRENSAQ